MPVQITDITTSVTRKLEMLITFVGFFSNVEYRGHVYQVGNHLTGVDGTSEGCV